MSPAPKPEASQRERRKLSIANMSVDYGGVPALVGVSIDFLQGEVHALLGPNGSGKSTLIKGLSGVVAPRPGCRISVGGESPVASLSPARASRLGLRFVHQDLALLPELSVLENIYLTNRYPTRGGVIDWRSARSRAVEVLDAANVQVDVSRPVSEMDHASKVLVAVARALLGRPATGGFVFVDEPTAALDQAESQSLLAGLRGLAAAGDVGIIMVTHRLGEVLAFADRISVLRDGRLVAELPCHEADEPSLLAMLGAADDSGPRDHRPAESRSQDGAPLLDVVALKSKRLDGLDLRVETGQIVGITGLEGSGTDDVVRLLLGMHAPVGGSMRLGGRPYAPRSVRDALAAGVNLVPADRLTLGGIGELDVGHNVLLPRFSDFAPHRWFRRRAAADAARRCVIESEVSPPVISRRMATLSGGNQQKVIVGRWLSMNKRLLVLHEPTAGVDAPSRRSLYRRLHDAAAGGLSVIVVSSDLVELCELCETVAVLVDGRLAATVVGADLSPERLIAECFAPAAHAIGVS